MTRPKKRVEYVILDGDYFDSVGMEMMNCHCEGSALTHDRRFRSNFGTSPEGCAAIWNLLDPYTTITTKGLSPKHLLWALMFLKVYAKESIHCSMAGGVDEKTFRKWVWLFIYEISFLESAVLSGLFIMSFLTKKTHCKFFPFSYIIWQKRFEGDIANDCLITVDGTDYEIEQPKPFSKIWYDCKHNGPGVRYEVAVSINGGDIVWINGPYKSGSWPDIKIFRDGILHYLEADE